MASAQLELWKRISGTHTAIHEFLAWLHDEHGVELDFDYANDGTPLDVRRLVDLFFKDRDDFDPKRLEKERRELLRDYRKAEEAPV